LFQHQQYNLFRVEVFAQMRVYGVLFQQSLSIWHFSNLKTYRLRFSKNAF